MGLGFLAQLPPAQQMFRAKKKPRAGKHRGSVLSGELCEARTSDSIITLDQSGLHVCGSFTTGPTKNPASDGRYLVVNRR